jgi:hypothetical protein
MAKKKPKPIRKKKAAPVARKRARKKKLPAKTRARSRKAAPRKKATRKKAGAKKRAKGSLRKKPTPRSRPYSEEDQQTKSADFELMEPPTERGLGPESGGQTGDTLGLSRAEIADSESVEELIEEGQAFEAGVISGVEDAPDADEGEIKTREVPADDVPQEYLDED